MMENYPLLLDHYWDIASNKILSSTLIFMFEKNSGDSFPSLPSMFTNTYVILSRYVPVEQKRVQIQRFSGKISSKNNSQTLGSCTRSLVCFNGGMNTNTF